MVQPNITVTRDEKAEPEDIKNYRVFYYSNGQICTTIDRHPVPGIAPAQGDMLATGETNEPEFQFQDGQWVRLKNYRNSENMSRNRHTEFGYIPNFGKKFGKYLS